MNPKKSANGIPPRFWKECADILAPSTTKLFKYIVKHSKWVSRWKIGRITAVHKRGSVKSCKNYRPLQVLENISVALETVLHPQLYDWISKFIPESQFGFLQGVGSREYGCTLLFRMLLVLEKRGEGILIPLDVKGAFDRVWWDRLRKRFQKKGMTKRALKLIKDYLFKRFLKVVCEGDVSTLIQIFSAVPQGAVWSPDFWDFDISELPDAISSEGDEFCYADDVGLWYEITAENRDVIIAIINLDLQGLVNWGNDNLTTFEPSKASFIVVSRKKDPFNPYERSAGIIMDGVQVERATEAKLVGFIFDEKLTFGTMVDKLARKARLRIAALRRLKPMLDSSNLRTMYVMFVRSILEYGNLAYMGAAQSHLDKLDRVQESAMKLGGFTIETLESRREAAAISLAFDLLDEDAYGELRDYKPELYEPIRLTKKRTRQAVEAGTQMKSRTRTSSLDQFRRSYLGSIHNIWAKLPQSLIEEGKQKSWQAVKSRAKRYLTGKWEPRPLAQERLKKEKKQTHKQLKHYTCWDAVWKEMKDQGIFIG